MKTYVADFETTTNPNDCRVWAYAICEVGNKDNVIVGTNIDDFMSWCRDSDNSRVFFHNLKFDGQFILSWLFNNGFTHINNLNERANNTFTTLISDKGLYYQIDVIFSAKGKKIKRVTFQDSLKLIPLSVDKIAKSFHLPIQKLEIDYEAHNNLPVDSPLSEEERDYIINDVRIVAYAIEYFHDQGLDRMTIGSCALEEYKKLVGKRNFERYYPLPRYHEDVKQSYRGGFTYLNPKFAGKILNEGITLDVNSLYPSVMYGCDNEYMPFGTPQFFEGEYKEDILYPLYTQRFKCQFEIKPGKIPCVQIKQKNSGFKSNEWLTSSENKEVTLTLNSVDLKLFFEHYNVYNIEYVSGWKFKATKGLFKEYIEKWSNAKIEAKKNGNHGLYLISKLFLNSLYGKFGTDDKVRSKIPYMSDGVVKYHDSDEEERDPIYVAIASFITSYARLKTISSAQKITDAYNSGKSDIEFVYADTDSLHLKSKGFKLPDCIDIDSTKLGAWDYELKWKKAKFLRQKCYIELGTEDKESENPDYKLKVTVAGMPKACHPLVTFENFKIGSSYKGKLTPKNVPGGVVLADTEFTIKE